MKCKAIAVAVLLVSAANLRADSQSRQSFDYLNNLRQQVGLIAFNSNPLLQKAAQGHAEYLYLNREWGHEQQWSKQGFTGRHPYERVLAAGYPSRHNSENVSSHSGHAMPMKSVNGLMSAIYHRFGFLSFDYDEIGIGHAADSSFHSFVYDLGNSGKRKLCEQPVTASVPGNYVFRICADESQRVKQSEFEQALLDVQLKNAEVVMWPPRGGNNVPPAFYDESPDPLPDYDVSGYPVSVQFNPAVFRNSIPQVSRFELFRDVDNKPVDILLRMDQRSDFNHKFTAFEHAIFPRERLEWNTRYRVEVDYYAHNKQQQLSWTFTTAGFDMPLYEVSNGGEVIRAQAGQTFAVYAPPADRSDARSEYQVSYRGLQDVKVTILDGNTLIIKPLGDSGQATFTFHGKRFQVVL